MKKFLLIILIFTLVTPFASAFVSPKLAQANINNCVVKLDLLTASDKLIAPGSTILANVDTPFRLRVTIEINPTGGAGECYPDLKYVVNANRTSTITDPNEPNSSEFIGEVDSAGLFASNFQNNRFSKITQLGGGTPPSAGVPDYDYSYAIIYQYKNDAGGATRRTKSIHVAFTNKKGAVTTPGGTGSGGQNPSTNSNTNTATQNNSTPNAQINTGVTATYKADLDTPLGFFINPLTKDTLPELLASILKILFILIGMISVIIIIIAGFRMVIASGNETELTKAKAAITWAIIGLIVSLMSFSIVAIIQRLIQVGA